MASSGSWPVGPGYDSGYGAGSSGSRSGTSSRGESGYADSRGRGSAYDGSGSGYNGGAAEWNSAGQAGGGYGSGGYGDAPSSYGSSGYGDAPAPSSSYGSYGSGYSGADPPSYGGYAGYDERSSSGYGERNSGAGYSDRSRPSGGYGEKSSPGYGDRGSSGSGGYGGSSGGYSRDGPGYGDRASASHSSSGGYGERSSAARGGHDGRSGHGGRDDRGPSDRGRDDYRRDDGYGNRGPIGAAGAVGARRDERPRDRSRDRGDPRDGPRGDPRGDRGRGPPPDDRHRPRYDDRKGGGRSPGRKGSPDRRYASREAGFEQSRGGRDAKGYGRDDGRHNSDRGRDDRRDDRGRGDREEDRKRPREDEQRRDLDKRRRDGDDKRQKEADERDRKKREMDELAARLRKQEEDAKKAQELKVADELAAKQRDQKVFLNVQNALMKFQKTWQEDFKNAEKEFSGTLQQELNDLSSEEKKKQCEEQANKVIAEVRKRVEAQEEKKRQEEEAAAQLKARQEDIDSRVAELTDLVDISEAKVDLLKESVTRIKSDNIEAADLTEILSSIEEQREDAENAHVACYEYIQAGNEDADSKECSLAGFVKASPELTTPVLKELLDRVAKSILAAKTLMTEAGEAKATSITKTIAQKVLNKEEEAMTTYGVGASGMWTREQVTSYAKSEYDFDIGKAALDRLFETLTPDPSEKGDSASDSIHFPRMTMIRSAIGIARELEKQRLRKEAREEEERRIAAEKAARDEVVKASREKWKARFDTIAEEFKKAEQAAGEVEPKVRKLPQAKNQEIPEAQAEELKTTIPTLEELVGECRKLFEAIPDRGANEDIETELKPWRDAEEAKMKLRENRMKGRVTGFETTIATVKTKLAKRTMMEVEKTRSLVLAALRGRQKEQELTLEDLFSAIDKDEDGVVSKTELSKFLTEVCEVGVEETDLMKFLMSLDGICRNASEGLDLEDFLRLLRICYKVTDQPIVMTENLSITKDHKVLRKLAPGEVLGVYEGPRKEECGALRVRGKAFRDGIVGWVTVSGSKGTAFLEEGGGLYKVLRPTSLRAPTSKEADEEPAKAEAKETEKAEAAEKTEAAEAAPDSAPADGSSAAAAPETITIVRMLRQGELLELTDVEATGKKGEVSQIRCKAKDDGAFGIASLSDDKGAVFLQAA